MMADRESFQGVEFTKNNPHPLKAEKLEYNLNKTTLTRPHFPSRIYCQQMTEITQIKYQPLINTLGYRPLRTCKYVVTGNRINKIYPQLC